MHGGIKDAWLIPACPRTTAPLTRLHKAQLCRAALRDLAPDSPAFGETECPAAVSGTVVFHNHDLEA